MLHCVAAAATLTFSLVASGWTGRAAAGTAGSTVTARTAATRAPRAVRARRVVVVDVRVVAGEAGGTGLPEVALAVRDRSVGAARCRSRRPQQYATSGRVRVRFEGICGRRHASARRVAH